VHAVVKRGTKIIPGEGTGTFIMPVKGATLSSRYGMRGGRMHKGLDFTSGNRNIYASDTGRVVFAGYQNNGYGNIVIIDHRNGYQTKYAHLSKIQVRSGQNIGKGEVLGIMGDTGNSDGVHLHFEIFKNGAVVNPSKHLYR
jgi:murein DD-endopeptidase MepM/ murein hydrolase activator NlpD